MKKLILTMMLMLSAMGAYSATKNYVPRATGEGTIGSAAKNWLNGYFYDFNVTYGMNAATVAVSGASALTTLTVSGTSALNGNNTIGDNTADTLTVNSGTAYIVNDLILSTAAVYPATSVIKLVSSTGRVGIGTSAPAVALDVVGAATISTTLGVTGATTITSPSFSVGTSTFVVTSGKIGILTNSPSKNLEIGGATALLGSTSGGADTSGNNLTIVAGRGNGAGKVGGNLYLGAGRGGTSATSGFIYLGNSQSSDSAGLATTAMTVDNDNSRVGIGTTAPLVTLQLADQGGLGIGTITSAQMQAKTPAKVGVLYWNTDNSTLYASTDTATACAFKSVYDGTTGCP